MSTHFYPLKVERVVHETPEAVSIYFTGYHPTIFAYKPGQYLTFRIPIEGKYYHRAYSLSSTPQLDDFLRITVKAIPGGKVSNYLKQNIQVGDELLALPPMGKFTIPDAEEQPIHYLLIAGGSGITPIFSILRSLLYYHPQSRISLLYANRYEHSIIFNDALEELKERFPERFHLTHILSRPSEQWQGLKGRIEGERAYQLITEQEEIFPLKEKRYYICGPYGMIQNVIDVLIKKGVEKGKVFTELFTSPLPLEPEVEIEESEVVDAKAIIHLDGQRFEIEVPAGKSILEAALDAGLDPPYACQQGICCTCRAQLYKGNVDLREREGLSDDEIDEGFILTCQSYPTTKVVELEYK